MKSTSSSFVCVRARGAHVGLVCLVVLAACAAPPEPTGTPGVDVVPLTLRPEEASRLARPDDATFTTRGVHGITGEAVHGADVFAIDESNHPLPMRFWSLRQTTTNEDGFVQGPIAQAWWVVRGTRLGPRSDLTSVPPNVVALPPSIDVPIRVVDWLGRPIPDATIGFCAGCGHTPDLANATTGADGIAWLRGIDPRSNIADVYPSDFPVELDYLDIQWHPGDAPQEIAFRTGEAVHGVVLDDTGTPVSGALVGAWNLHRGPWTRTARDGSFRLLGLQASDSFFVVHGDREIECPWPASMPFEIRLPVDDGKPRQALRPEPEGADAPVTVDVDVQLVDAQNRAIPDAEVEWTADDGSTGTLTSGDAELVPGVVRVRSRHPEFDVADERVEIPAAAGGPLRIVLTPLPRVRLHVRGMPGDTERRPIVEFVRREGTFPLTWGTPMDLPLRNDEEFAIRLALDGEAGDGSRWFRFRAAAALARGEIHVDWYRPTTITAECVDADGVPVAVDVALRTRMQVVEGGTTFDPRATTETSTFADGLVTLGAETERLCFLWVRPHDAALHPRLVPVAMPARGDEVRVDVGRIVLRREPQLRLVDAAGKAVGERASWLRAGIGDFADRSGHPSFPLGDGGAWLGPDLAVGDAVQVGMAREGGEDFEVLPFRHVVTSTVPHVVRRPQGRIRLEFRDESGQPVDVMVWLRDQSWEWSGAQELRQLPVGPVRLHVRTPAGRLGHVDVRCDGGTSEVRVVVPRG